MGSRKENLIDYHERIAEHMLPHLPGAPVATPLDWDELDANLKPDQYTVTNIFRRLGQGKDPWSGLYRHGRSLSEPRKRLDEVQGELKEDSGE